MLTNKSLDKMKRLFLTLFAGCLLAAAASAQTLPAGTMFVNPTLTNLGFNAVTASVDGNKESFSRFGFQASGGYAIMDDLAIVAGAGLQGGKYESSGVTALNLFAGARYYIPMAPGFFAGANLTFGTASVKNNLGSSLDDEDFDIDTASIKANTLGVEINAGYSYFLTKSVAFEPSLSFNYGLSTKVQGTAINLSVFTLNLGFLFLL